MLNRSQQLAARRYANGFTLIEMMVVVVIIGVVITMAVLAMGAINGNRKVKAQAQHLMQVILTAKQQAILQPATLGLRFSAAGYQFYVFKHDDKGKYQWHRLSNRRDQLSAPNAFDGNIVVKLMKVSASPLIVKGKQHKQPMIVFSDSGDITPFNLLIGDGRHTILYRLQLSQVGELTLKNITGQSHER